MSTCPDIAALESLARHRTAPSDDATLREHLESCPDCHALLESIRRNEQLLGRVRGALESATPAPAAVGYGSGTRLGEFIIEGILGVGGMGAVYLARQDNPNRLVALKVMSQALASADARSRFQQEVQLLGRLQHPGIARIYAAGGEDDALPWFAMELVAGQRLAVFLERNTVSDRTRIELLEQLCDTVEFAHTRGVIHRDLKPANIMIERNAQGAPVPKVLDFGVARAVGADVPVVTQNTSAGLIVGTLAYMSPEQAIGASKATPPALLMASSSGRGAMSRNGNDLIAAARRSG